MGQKSKSKSFTRFILDGILLLPTLYNLVGKIFMLIEYEARLVRKNFIKIIILAVISGIVLTSTWLCLLLAFGLYLISIGSSYLLTFFVIILINILILLILGIMIKASEKNLFFRATRSHIRHALKKRE